MLEAAIVRLSWKYPTIGYKKITHLLGEKGYTGLTRNRVQRIRLEEGLQVLTTQAAKAPPMSVHRLASRGQTRESCAALGLCFGLPPRDGNLRVLSIVKEFTQECPVLHADRVTKAADVLALLQQMISRYGPPLFIRSDNGPEFIAEAIQKWLLEHQMGTIYIDSGSPWQNGYAESFNNRFRAKCLDHELLNTLSESRVVGVDWREEYNNIRPQRCLGLLTAVQFVKKKTAPRHRLH